jgi:hypothetical protein
MWVPSFLRPRVSTAPTVQYHRAPFYPVGAGDAVYEPAFPVVPRIIPIVNFSGNGVLAGNAPNPIHGPQVFAFQTGLVAGVGGSLAGQFITQPLNIPDTTNGSQ